MLIRERDALEDKIEVQLGIWAFDAGDEEGFKKFKNHLAGPPKDEQKTTSLAGTAPVFGTFFCRPAGKGADYYKLKIRSYPLQTVKGKIAPPLCAGHMQFTRVSQNSHHYNAHLSLFLNLARFVRHQVKADEMPPETRENVKTKARLRRRTNTRNDFGFEATFIKDDNWIPDETAWASFARSNADEWHLKRYILGLINAVNKDVRRAALYAGFQKHQRPKLYEHYLLRLVETFWEFSSDNPIEDVKLIETQAKNLRSGDVHVIPRNVTGTGRIQNSISFTIKLRRDCSLRVYAKTNRRIRFEVIQESLFAHRSSLLGKAASIGNDRPFSEIFPVMTAVRKRAKKLFESFCKDLGNSYGYHPRQRTPLEFLAIVAQAVPPYADLKEREAVLMQVLSCVVENQGWVNAKPGGTFGAVLSILHRRGVLTRNKVLQRYQIGDRFRAAAMALRKMREETMDLLVGYTQARFKRAIRDR